MTQIWPLNRSFETPAPEFHIKTQVIVPIYLQLGDKQKKKKKKEKYGKWWPSEPHWLKNIREWMFFLASSSHYNKNGRRWVCVSEKTWTWRSWPVGSSWVLSWFRCQPVQQAVPAFWVWCRAQLNTDPSPPVTAALGSPDRWLKQRWAALCWSGYHRCKGPPLQHQQNTHLEASMKL